MQRKCGMTMIEVMIALVIMSLVAVGVASTLTRSWQSQETLVAQNEVQRRAWEAVDKVVDTLRGGVNVTAADATSITVSTLDSGSHRFYLAGDELTHIRTVSNPSGAHSEKVMTKVSSFTVTLYQRVQSALAVTTDLTAARAANVSLTVTNGRYHATVASLVYLRNRAPGT